MPTAPGNAPGPDAPLVPYVPGGPERSFRVSDVGGRATGCSARMRTGPWTSGADGRPSPAALGVLLDVAIGGAAVAHAPQGHWGVTIDLYASFGARMPGDGSDLALLARSTHHDRGSAIAAGEVLTDDGRVVATAVQRVRFVAGAPRTDTAPAAAVAGDGDLLGTIGAHRSTATVDEVELLVATTAGLANPAGVVHGGIQFALAAEAAALAAPELDLSSVHVAYVRPCALGDELRVRTSTSYRGRTAALVEVRCLRTDGKAASVATVTCGPRV